MRRKSRPTDQATAPAPTPKPSQPKQGIEAATKMRARLIDLADLMDEFQLGEAELRDGETKIGFKRTLPQRTVESHAVVFESAAPAPHEPAAPSVPPGVPITSPMNGIFYTSPSPSAPPFVREGEPVVAGQVVGLIEAMKVFNEITASTSGTVSKIVAEGGQMVQPGDPLVYIAVG